MDKEMFAKALKQRTSIVKRRFSSVLVCGGHSLITFCLFEYIAPCAFHNKSLCSFPLYHLCPNPSFGISERAVWFHHHRLLSLGAGHERESPPGGKNRNFGFQESKTHSKAGARALAKGLECVPGSSGILRVNSFHRNLTGSFL